MFEGRDDSILTALAVSGRIAAPVLNQVRGDALAGAGTVADLVVARGLIDGAGLLAAVAEYLGLVVAPALPAELSAELLALIPAGVARNFGVVPVRSEAGGVVVVAAVDPFDTNTAADLAFALGRGVRLVVADPREVRRLLQRHFGVEPESIGDNAAAVGEERGIYGAAGPSVSELAAMAQQAPVVRFVDLVLSQAVRDHASDIHFEPFEGEYKIRYRIDGVLHEMTPPPAELAVPIASRIKVLADLDIAERRLPQDGRIRTRVEGRAIDLRVSTLPTQCGESIVLRVLDQSAVRLGLDELGMPAEVLAGVRDLVRRPHGIFVVTGPTGSGKTTTLYSGLRSINTVDLKLLTVEDPVEYDLDGIMQVPVNPAAGLTFGSALRAFLRQDPDVIMVGEIRDLETAQIAMQASLTGHLVLSTLHTNDAASAVTRLLDLGVESFLVAATLEGVLAQRLLRRVCRECRAPVRAAAERGSEAGDVGEGFFRGRGCAACDDTGYRGRVGVYEWLPLTERLRDLVGDAAPVQRLRAEARKAGYRSLRDDALRVARAGETTLEEVWRHT